MRKPHVLSVAAVAGAFTAALLLSRTSSAMQPQTAVLDGLVASLRQSVAPLPPRPALDQDVVALGRALYHDATLSRTNAVSCATCHPLATAGTTPEPLTTRGVNGMPALFNTPTTWNAARSTRQAWRADAADVAELLERPFFKESCMGNKDWPELLQKIDERYQKRFARAGVAFDKGGVDGALVAYLEAIEPRGSPVDRWLAGDDHAVNDEAKRGGALFEQIGCVACHNGAGVGGVTVARFGLAVADPYVERGICADKSYCRSDVDCGGVGACMKGVAPVRDADLGVPAGPGQPPTYQFRVPSLRNVARTGPWFHDGSARTLDEAVRTMAHLQLGRTLTDDEAGALVAFLGALTGELPAGELALASAR